MEKVRQRQEIPLQFRWNLESIYATDAAWEAEFEQVRDRLLELRGLAGTLGQSAQALLKALQLRDEISLVAERLLSYAHMRRDEDTRKAQYQALADRIMGLIAQLGGATAFFEPELLALPTEQVEAFVKEEPGLQVYEHFLQEILRQKAHVRSAEVEELLAQASEVGQASKNTFEMLNHADMVFPKVKDGEGNEIELTHGRFMRLMEHQKREVRKGAFEALYATYEKQKNTLAATLGGSIKKDIFFARARNYGSALEAALAPNNIPLEVYHNLVETVNKNLPSLHRYLALRKKMLGLDELHMYDVYVPMVEGADQTISYDEAKETVLKALAPLGADYIEKMRQGFESRWIDVYESEGKTSGAYSWGAYSTQPFILLNHQDNLNSMFTLAHELGHSMHSLYTRANQPYVYGDYTIFVAEVASTLNEALLADYLLKQEIDKKTRMYLINYQLETFRTTLYRQTMFAEFELETHRLAEAGEALTAELLCEVYLALNKKYYGDGTVSDPQIAIEWARIPHFYRAFYVYQYATGISAAAALAQKILNEGQPAVDAYLGFLSGGSSDYSINLLKGAGVDMTSPEPVQQALDKFAELLSELEALAEAE